jgi:hypothetical protein
MLETVVKPCLRENEIWAASCLRRWRLIGCLLPIEVMDCLVPNEEMF